MPGPRQPTEQEREALIQFARLEISLDDLCGHLQGVLQIDFSLKERRLTSHLNAEPGIRLEKKYVLDAAQQKEKGVISARQLSDWAAMLIMNDCYDWEGLDQQAVDQLNDLALL